MSKIFLYVQRRLSSLGFTMKLEKCPPEPTRCLVFLSAVLDTTCMSCSARGTDQSTTGSMTGNARNAGLSSLLGRTSHATRTGLWVAVQSPATPASSASPPVISCQILLSQPSLEDLRWWVSSALHGRNSHDITPPFDWAGHKLQWHVDGGDAGVWRRQNNTSIVWKSKQPF